MLCEKVNSLQIVFLTTANQLCVADLLQAQSLAFDSSSKVFSTIENRDFSLELSPLSIPVPKFHNPDLGLEKETPVNSQIYSVHFCGTVYDQLLLVYEQGLAVVDLGPLTRKQKSVTSELMIMNWPGPLLDSILKLKDKQGDRFFSAKIRRKVHEKISKKVNPNDFENPKFLTLFLNKNRLMINQIELMKENQKLSFGQIPMYFELATLLSSVEILGQEISFAGFGNSKYNIFK